MSMDTPDPGISATPGTLAPASVLLRGEVAFLYGFDVAYDTRRPPLKTLLGEPVEWFGITAGKRAPRELFFYRPATVRLPGVEVDSPSGPVRARVTLKLFPVGAVSVCVAVPFEVPELRDLVAYHDLVEPERRARAVVERAMAELRPWLIRPVGQLRHEEAYTVFCLEWPGTAEDDAEEGGGAERWLTLNRRQIAALLTQEPDARSLSQQEVQETAGRYLSYYRHDLAVIDWDAALLVDEPGQFQSLIHIFELANVQLAELEAYDRLLDEVVDGAYRNLARRGFSKRKSVLADLRELRIDMARLSDELSNTTKFFGEWHLARVYQQLYDRFHIPAWHRTVESKLRTLDDLYRISRQDQMNSLMMVLEFTIVGLFVIDLLLLFLLGR